MNLLNTIIRPIITLCSLILIPNYKKKTIETIRKLSTTFILLQIIHLHIETTENIKQITLLFTRKYTINTITLKIQHLCIDTLSTSLMLLTLIVVIICVKVLMVFLYARKSPMKNFICVVEKFMLYSVVMLMVFSVWCILNMVMKRGREPMMV